MMRGRWGSKKRGLAVAAAGALAVGIVAPMLAPDAGAVIANPGNVRVSMQLSVFTPSFTVAGMSSKGTGSATVQQNGLVRIPQSSLAFSPVQVQVNLPVAPDPTSTNPSSAQTAATAVTVQAVATSDFTGALDPNTGAAFLIGNIEELWSHDARMPSCPVGPFRVVVRTNTQGGIGYSPQNGNVTMVDPGFTVDSIPTAASGCEGLEGSINEALSLPVTTTTTTTRPGFHATPTTLSPYNTDPPVPSVLLSVTFSPAPKAGALPPPPPTNKPQAPDTTTKTTTGQPVTNVVPPPAVGNGSQSSGGNNGGGGGGGGGGSNRNNNKSKSKKVRHPGKHNNGTKTPPKFGVKKPAKAGNNTLGTYIVGGKGTKYRPPTTTAKKPGTKKLTFVAAAFTKRSPSALTTALNLLGLVGLLIFTALALWLVTSEVSAFSAGQRRRRTHRIAGITK